ncbi:unnamed protein product [Meloidogyne enterolobii]|uniref:Uncharacterized protein n=2 Tax=Meloidogyne enterolobii TaxID=390850 RepID=A0ACB0Z352_MELEN
MSSSSQQIIILIFLFNYLINIILAENNCDTKQSLNSYLSCLKGELDKEYSSFEEELKLHTRKAASVCFAQNIADANSQERCVLSVSDLEQKAWDRNGPLRDCSICRTFATGAIKAILSTPADEQKCIREQISKAIAVESESCLRKKVQDFGGIPEIPDLEEGGSGLREEVIDSISDYIWIHSRLAFCAERKPERAAKTRECLKSPFLGFYSKHCRVLNSCDQIGAQTAECVTPLKTTKAAVCACIDEARDDLKQRIAGIADAIKEAVDGSGSRAAPSIGSGSKVDQCVSNIKRQLITSTNDWASTIDNALNNCIKNKPNSQNLGIDSLLNVGCRKIIADTTGNAQIQIKAGFEFVNNLVDSMVERSRRFCGGTHCDSN